LVAQPELEGKELQFLFAILLSANFCKPLKKPFVSKFQATTLTLTTASLLQQQKKALAIATMTKNLKNQSVVLQVAANMATQ
jgi:hypothetical protein